MSVSKKHMEFAAHQIQEAVSEVLKNHGTGKHSGRCVRIAADMYAEFFSFFSERFDRRRFLEACEVWRIPGA